MIQAGESKPITYCPDPLVQQGCVSVEDDQPHSSSRNSLIGVVTVTYNSAGVIDAFIASLLKQTDANFVLYVVDNASSDGTLKCASQYVDQRIVILRNGANVGAAEGNNIGIRAALRDRCTHVLLVNNDTVLHADLLSELLLGMNHHGIDIAVPKILYFDEPARIWSAGGYFSWFRGSARHFGSNCEDKGQFDQPRTVRYSPSTCMLVRAEVFSKIGLMDPTYFAYFEDTDFCYRAFERGIKLFYIPSARLLHRVSSLTGRDSEFTVKYSIRNHVYYVLKNFPAWQCWLYLPALQLHVVFKFIFFRRSVHTFWLAEKAFLRGILLFHASTGKRDIADECGC